MKTDDYFSYTRLRTFDHCNRYYYYHYELGFPVEPTFEAEYSSIMIHPAIAALYKGDPSFSFDDQWATLETFGLENPAPRILTLDKAVLMSTKYWQELGIADMDDYVLVIAEEKIFDDDQQFQSVPDIVLKAPHLDTVLILDNKVSLYEPKPILSSFNRQLISQALAVNRHFSFNLRRIWIGINYFNLRSEMIVREIMPLDLQRVEEYRQEYVHKRGQIGACELANMWPKNAPDACIKYYGRKKKICEFWKCCEGAKDVQSVPGSSTSSMSGPVSVSPG